MNTLFFLELLLCILFLGKECLIGDDFNVAVLRKQLCSITIQCTLRASKMIQSVFHFEIALF